MKRKDGYQSRLGRILHIEEQRREGKRPPREKRESGEEFAAKAIQAVVDETGELPHPDVLGPFLDVMVPNRAKRADRATTLRPDPAYDATRKLFAEFDLDPGAPEDWAVVVHVMAIVLYGGPRKKPGRPKGADELLREAVKAEFAARPKASNRDVTRAIAKKTPELLNKGRHDGMIGLERKIRRERKQK